MTRPCTTSNNYLNVNQVCVTDDRMNIQHLHVQVVVYVGTMQCNLYTFIYMHYYMWCCSNRTSNVNVLRPNSAAAFISLSSSDQMNADLHCVILQRKGSLVCVQIIMRLWLILWT